MDVALVAVLALSFAVALANWRAGLLLALLAGFLQDPLRKMVDDEPVYLSALAGVMFVMVVIAMALRRVLPRPAAVHGWRGWLRWPVTVCVMIIAVQALHAFARSGSMSLALLGLGGYLMPLPAVLVGYHFARDERTVRRFLTLYALLVVVVSVTIYLSFAGCDWAVFRQVGPGLRVFIEGGVLDLHTGLWRSPEVAAWHAGAALCFLVIVGTVQTRPGAKVLIAGLVIYLAGAGLLTGRRKMLIQTVVFLALYVGLLAYLRHGARKLGALAVVIGLTGAFAFNLIEPSQARFNPYLRHGTSGFVDAPGRLETLGLGSLRWAISRHGLFGIGAGLGTQGAQHFGGGTTMVGGTAEGGLGRVVTELGLPGLFVTIWLALSVGRLTWRSMRRGPSGSNSSLRYGLAAFMAANAVTFVVASQVFGDMFVLLILGGTIGLLLASLRERREALALRTAGRLVAALPAT